MIKNHGEHAANERTFLAWVRTAIAVMAFGFLVEKFDLFLRLGGLAKAQVHHPGLRLGEAAGLALMVLGLGIVAIAIHRFLRIAREIDDETLHEAVGSRFDVALALLLFLLGCALTAYMVANLAATR